MVIGGTSEKYGIKENFSRPICFLCFGGSPDVGLVFMICNSISSNFPSGGIEILADGSIVKMETPTETQQNILSMLGIIQIVSCIVLPMGGLALSGILYYHIKLKQPISTLRNGISRIRNHDLDFSMPVHSDDELGQLCTAFDTMREELLKSNQELWRQAEEREKAKCRLFP